MVDLYLSPMSQKTNVKMKVLAVISTSFMPLVLIAGIYGMNFQHIPELGWEFSYPMVLLFLLIVGIILVHRVEEGRADQSRRRGEEREKRVECSVLGWGWE